MQVHFLTLGFLFLAISACKSTSIVQDLTRKPELKSELGDFDSSKNERLISLAKKMAPIFYFHPTEEYEASSPEWFIARAGLKYIDRNRNIDYMIIPPGKIKSFEQLISQKGTIPGAKISYDSSGPPDGHLHLFIGKNEYEKTARGNLESARCFARPHRIVKENGVAYIDIPYAMFYPYNPRSEYDTLINPIKHVYNGTTYLLNEGAHEGDIEHITIRVDPDTEAIVAVFYSAHGHEDSSWYFNPAQTEKDGDDYLAANDGYKMEGDSIIAFSARGTHGMYNRIGESLRRTLDAKTDSWFKWFMGKFILANERLGLGKMIRCSDSGKMDIFTEADGKYGEKKLSWLAFSGRWGSFPPGVRGDDGPFGLMNKSWWTGAEEETGEDAKRFAELESKRLGE